MRKATDRANRGTIALSRQSFSRALFKTGNQFSSPHSFFLALSFSRHRTVPRSRVSNIPWPCFGDFPLPAIWELVRGKHQLMRVRHFRMSIFFPVIFLNLWFSSVASRREWWFAAVVFKQEKFRLAHSKVLHRYGQWRRISGYKHDLWGSSKDAVSTRLAVL